MVNEREIALESLIEIIEKGSYSHIVEKAVLDKYDYLENNKKAFIKKTVDGTVENVLLLDEVINRYATTKTDRQKPLIRNLLRMSTYQILFMDKVPDSAVCNEAVKLAKRHGFGTLSGFVNGILRKISSEKAKIDTDDMEILPEWMRRHLIKQYGEDIYAKIVKSIKEPHPVTIRARRPLKNTDGLVKSKLCENAYILNKGIGVASLEGYAEGDFVVQDISSMMVCKYADIKKGDTVFDVCAAPGGKAIHAWDMGGRVTACDAAEIRCNLMRENIKRCGIDDIVVRCMDAREYDASMKESADVLLADVPCSGLGILGKKSDIRLKIKEEDLERLAILQREILTVVQEYVKKGGVLMYSTCTLDPEENIKQAEWLAENFPFEIEFVKQYIQGVDETDGFFIARLRKKA